MGNTPPITVLKADYTDTVTTHNAVRHIEDSKGRR
jgi:hypothetical protein